MTLATPVKSPSTPFHPLLLTEVVSLALLIPLSVEQYQLMIEQGIVPEDNSVELLRGMLVRKDRSSPGEDPMGHSPLHKLIVSLLISLAGRIESVGRHMQIQLPVACPPDGAPEPDGSVIRGKPRDYLDRLPGKGEVFSVIEASHTSLTRDREDKLAIYAASGVPQYLIINLWNDTIEIFEEPDAQSETYRSKTTMTRGGRVKLKVGDQEIYEFDAADVLP